MTEHSVTRNQLLQLLALALLDNEGTQQRMLSMLDPQQPATDVAAFKEYVPSSKEPEQTINGNKRKPNFNKRSPELHRQWCEWQEHETQAVYDLLAMGDRWSFAEVGKLIGRSRDSVRTHYQKVLRGEIPVKPHDDGRDDVETVALAIVGQQQNPSPWVKDEDERLLELLAAGQGWARIAQTLGRTYESCRSRAALLRKRAVDLEPAAELRFEALL